jgi:hypothetical protein
MIDVVVDDIVAASGVPGAKQKQPDRSDQRAPGGDEPERMIGKRMPAAAVYIGVMLWREIDQAAYTTAVLTMARVRNIDVSS